MPNLGFLPRKIDLGQMDQFTGKIYPRVKKILMHVSMHPVGFEPTPPERIELESTALDHSATDA